jgi:hypothetical protein
MIGMWRTIYDIRLELFGLGFWEGVNWVTNDCVGLLVFWEYLGFKLLERFWVRVICWISGCTNLVLL